MGSERPSHLLPLLRTILLDLFFPEHGGHRVPVNGRSSFWNNLHYFCDLGIGNLPAHCLGWNRREEHTDRVLRSLQNDQVSSRNSIPSMVQKNNPTGIIAQRTI